jgi:hypothetical protein
LSNTPSARSAELRFREVQPFRQKRLLILTAIPPAAMLARTVLQMGFGIGWGHPPESNASLIGWTVFLWLIYLRLVTITLVTELFPAELRVTMRGMLRSARIRVDKIESVRTVTFDPKEWGGYGMRSNARGRAYIARGTQAVELTMTGGRVVLIGTQKARELESAVRSARGS